MHVQAFVISVAITFADVKMNRTLLGLINQISISMERQTEENYCRAWQAIFFILMRLEEAKRRKIWHHLS